MGRRSQREAHGKKDGRRTHRERERKEVKEVYGGECMGVRENV